MMPLRPASLLLACAAVFAIGCTGEPRAADAAGLPLHALELGRARLAIRLPLAARVTPVGSAQVLIQLRPGTRTDPTIRLAEAASRDAPGMLPAASRLDSGATLSYGVRMLEGGSGGAEAELEGRLEWPGGPVLRVTCRDQREHPPPEPRWCIAWLHHLQRA